MSIETESWKRVGDGMLFLGSQENSKCYFKVYISTCLISLTFVFLCGKLLHKYVKFVMISMIKVKVISTKVMTLTPLMSHSIQAYPLKVLLLLL